LSGAQLTNPDSNIFTTSGDLKLRLRFTQYEKSGQSICGKVDNLECVKRRAAEDALNDFAFLKSSSEFADLEIKTSDGEVFKAHKLILAGAF
jgi:hypothetical protein